MPERDIFDDLSAFFDGIPEVVRSEISLLLVVLADDPSVDTDGWADCERSARSLFNAAGRFGRFGDLIKAVGILDVYFAADPRERLGSAPARPGPRRADRGGSQSEALSDRYASRLVAIDRACSDWQLLRQTRLTSAAISAALMQRDAPGQKEKSRSIRLHSDNPGAGIRQAGV